MATGPSSAVVAAVPVSGSGSESGPGGVPAWVWGLVIGLPVAAGVAYYLLSAPPDEDEAATAEKRAKKKAAKKKKSSASPATSSPAASSPAKPATSEAAASQVGVTIEDVPEDPEPTDPLERAVSAKNKGNKYFRGGRYELAIKCYSEAIQICPENKTQDLSTFHQNRAAAYDQLANHDAVVSDCTVALKLNAKYIKALERRARACRKQATELADRPGEEAVDKLRQALEDITAVCILEGFQKQEHLLLVDTVLKELGRAEAREAVKHRQPVLTSAHFIQQYFQSFCEDPIVKSVEKEDEADVDEQESQKDNSISGLSRAKAALREERYADVLPACNDALACSVGAAGDAAAATANGETDATAAAAAAAEARLLRATFRILSKQQEEAFADLKLLIDDDSLDAKVRANALIKRASLYIQRCQDPIKDPQMSFDDFETAANIDPDNADIYHHRGQVHLLTDNIVNAVADFERAVELKPGFGIARVQKLYTDYRKAQADADNEAINNVINSFEAALESFPKCVESYALFAQVLSEQQQFERADALYVRAIAVDPRNANLLVHRGLIQLQWRGDVAKAIELMQRALEMDEKCEFAYETLGTIEVQRGNLSKAVELFDKAIPLANTELEMGHLFGLKNAAVAQTKVSANLGISLPPMGLQL